MNTIIVLVAGYITMQLVADVCAVKIVSVLGFTFPAATFIYALTFTWRDIMHSQMGKRGVKIAIYAAAVCNVLMALYFLFSARLPPAVFWSGQDAFETTLGIVWRIVLASILAEVVSELVDTEIYDLLKSRRMVGILTSNTVATIVDSILFVSLAFFGTMPIAAMWGVVLGQILAKMAMTSVALPVAWVLRKRW